MVLIIKHEPIEGPGTLREFLRNTDYETKIIELSPSAPASVKLKTKKASVSRDTKEASHISPYKAAKLPEDFSQIEAVIILGGPMNVYEERRYPFLKEEDRFIKKALEEKIPILGICLGAQLLAKACGARITKNAKKEIGWCEIELTKQGAADPFFQGIEKSFETFEWHEDTFEVPRGGELLAKSETCKNQAFRFGENAYGLQFHPEVTGVMIDEWSEKYTNTKNAHSMHYAKDMIMQYGRIKKEFNENAQKMYLNFFRIITV